jgi:hypothetical protein
MAYVDAVTKESVLQSSSVEPLRGMLGVPDGSGGGKMTVILDKRDCGLRIEDYDSKGLPTRFSHLNLTKVPTDSKITARMYFKKLLLVPFAPFLNSQQ